MKGKPLTRRAFMGHCAAGAASVGAISRMDTVLARQRADLSDPTRISLIFAHPSSEGPCWPNIGYDFEGAKADFLRRIRSSCPDIEFHPHTVMSEKDAAAVLASNDALDGYLLYMAGCLWGNVSESIAAAGKPVVYVDNLFAGSGEFLTSYARIRRVGAPVIPVSSSRFEDVADAVRCIDAVTKLRHSRALVVGREPDHEIEKVYGTRMIAVPFDVISDAYHRSDEAEASACAEKWIERAEKIIEPQAREIVKSARLYHAMRALLSEHGAQAITVNCLGGFYGGHLPAYPCLGFMQLDDEGSVGACEADQRSTLTKLLMRYLIDRPGFISDPVIDTAQNQIVYAHCVAPTRVFGPGGEASPYHLRDHSEDRKGACNRSLMPLGQTVTTMMFDHRKRQVILHQGCTKANLDIDRACRNKLAVEVQGDVYKLLNYWDEWGWHRVTFFGDFKRHVENVATLLGFEVVYEA